jgi:hypothetical protein
VRPRRRAATSREGSWTMVSKLPRYANRVK